ncbi:ribonuclease H-like domain-containing protein, partial [Tanacetum coccineum]
MWLNKNKYNADRSLSRYKARLVANGRSQQQGIDCDKPFSPVVKPATIRTVLSLVVSRQWPIYLLDVKNAFLHDHLIETKSLYEPVSITAKPTRLFSSFTRGQNTTYLLLYVDDIILIASSTSLMQRIISSLHAEFAMTDLGPLNYFLSISAMRPVDTEKKLGPEGSPVTDPTLYRSLARALQYLTFTRPDLSYAAQQLCLYIHDPREPHLNAMKRVLCYLRGTTDYGLQLFQFTSSQLIAYSDADWAGCPATSRAEADYRGVANAVAKTSWIRKLLRRLLSILSKQSIQSVSISIIFQEQGNYLITGVNAKNLTTIKIGYNNISGSIPLEFGNSIQVLDLSSNHLVGQIPKEFGEMKSLLNLNLSDNNLSCVIPQELGSLHGLLTLDLSKNSLNGNLPRGINIDVSYNEITGPVPPYAVFLNVSGEALQGNAGLCRNVTGGYGTVYKAELQPNNLVAVKKLHSLSENDDHIG